MPVSHAARASWKASWRVGESPKLSSSACTRICNTACVGALRRSRPATKSFRACASRWRLRTTGSSTWSLSMLSPASRTAATSIAHSSASCAERAASAAAVARSSSISTSSSCFNDTYGHTRGDEVLRSVAHTLDETFRRGGDLVARYGGEEFAVVLPGVDGRRAGLYAERLRRRIWRLAIPYGASQLTRPRHDQRRRRNGLSARNRVTPRRPAVRRGQSAIPGEMPGPQSHRHCRSADRHGMARSNKKLAVRWGNGLAPPKTSCELRSPLAHLHPHATV